MAWRHSMSMSCGLADVDGSARTNSQQHDPPEEHGSHNMWIALQEEDSGEEDDEGEEEDEDEDEDDGQESAARPRDIPPSARALTRDIGTHKSLGHGHTAAAADAAAAAGKADATVIIVGLDVTQECEGHDRKNVTAPGEFEHFVLGNLDVQSSLWSRRWTK